MNWGQSSDKSPGPIGDQESRGSQVLPGIKEEGWLEVPDSKKIRSADNGQTHPEGNKDDGDESEGGRQDLDEISSS